MISVQENDGFIDSQPEQINEIYFRFNRIMLSMKSMFSRASNVRPRVERAPLACSDSCDEQASISAAEDATLVRTSLFGDKADPDFVPGVTGLPADNVRQSAIDSETDEDDECMSGTDTEERFVVSTATVYNCTVCDKTFVTKQACMAHFSSAHESPDYGCNFCDATFSSQYKRNKHARAGTCRNVNTNGGIVKRLSNIDTASPADLVPATIMNDHVGSYLRFRQSK